MMQEKNYLADTLRTALPIGESFDLMERKLMIGGRDVSMFFVDGFVNNQVMPIVIGYLQDITKDSIRKAENAKELIQMSVPYLAASTESKLDMVLKQVFSGLIAVAIAGFDEVIMVDARVYPTRSVSEPSKEKSLRGAKDGFTEAFMMNIALIRRRIRDPKLIFEAHVVGERTKTDVSLVYIKGLADQQLVKNISTKLDQIKIASVSVGEQTIVEQLLRLDKSKKSFLGWLNPFPKVRYTERPDVVTAHLAEGKVAIIVDTSPTVILLPTGIFEFLQNADDYYFPALTGNFFRFLRTFNFIGILFLTPVFLLFAEKHIPSYEFIKFFIPSGDYAIPVFWQLILLEIAIDALKLASLSTPDSLGMSLSVIGALILGEFAVSCGWFIPQTILCMAVLALAGFTQPSIELGYAMKFMRVLMLFGIEIGGIWGPIGAISGAIVALIINFISLSTAKTLSGNSYLYPLFPFDKEAMRHLIFRTKQ
ncbi:spore germination protein [Clostridium aminobutyricum]|uniref:Spore germination protein n=1 Tax=Clostridium aminobutyricum TaxID=33953 RepID=A0A939D6J0_CLOAM|nr:spore germination protein [Clostridium aminobutyricum]MBN7771980.1 spore germination protein [Clostridium aminobutyricum]